MLTGHLAHGLASPRRRGEDDALILWVAAHDLDEFEVDRQMLRRRNHGEADANLVLDSLAGPNPCAPSARPPSGSLA